MKLRKHFLFLALLIIAFSFVLASCGLFNKKCKHEYIDEVVAPTCDTNGYTQHTCKKCDDTYKDSETAPTGHNYVPTVDAPGCTEPGITTYVCSYCQDTYTDLETSPTGHNYISAVVETSCSAEGYIKHTCSYCGDSYNDNYIPKTSHRFNGAACLYCEIEAPTDSITPDTEWYNESNMIFTLTTREELAGLAELVNSGTDFLNKIIYLGADIDLGYLAWTPIGNAEHPFIGTFNGNGYSISSLRISTHASYVGLFGKVTGKIANFTIDNATVYVTDVNNYVSIACGYSTSDLKDIHVDGYLDALHSNYVGAIVGYTTAQISNVSSFTEVVGTDYVGGIAGQVSCATALFCNIINYGCVNGANYTAGIAGSLVGTGTIYVENTENYGDVIGAAHTAGVLGYISGNTSSLIINSISSSDITGEYYVGAIAGESINVKISECSNAGSTVSATSCMIDGNNYYAYLGGYVGKGYIVEKCINESDINYISRGSYVGGIAGYLTHSITECSNNGAVKGYHHVGGLAGYISSGTSVTLSTLTNSGEISGNTYVGGIVGLWNYSNTFVVSGCENTGNVTGTDNVGGIAGRLTMASNNLLTISGLCNSGDITAKEGWVGGLFGYINGNTSSTVADCTSSADITGSYYVGGLIGQAVNLTLKDCSNKESTVTATGFIVEGEYNNVYLGGYIGSGASISGCINDNDIIYHSLGNRVGGIIGYSIGDIKDCNNNGNITSLGSKVGGIVGENNSPIGRIYSGLVNTGDIIAINNVGGIFGRYEQIATTSGGDNYYANLWCHNSLLDALTNEGRIVGSQLVGGIAGSLTVDNLWHWSSNNYGNFRIKATNFTNLGNIEGEVSTGELIGYFWGDMSSTLKTYTILGSITVKGETLEGDYSVGANTNLTLSDRVLPEGSEETEE